MRQGKTTLITISLLLAFGLSACDKPGPAEQAGKKMDQAASDTGKKVGEAFDKLEDKMTEQGQKAAQSWDDTEITAKLKAEFLGEPGLKSTQISVDTVNGVVTLTGTADSQASSDKAASMAMAVAGAREVNNQLVVTSAK
jgi:hyperosmotically inducible periplasmic protein